MFTDFDFDILDDPSFKEDSVREELISPLLKALGYSAFGSNKIIRSKNLVHPYVYIGSKKQKINIIPDYVLSVEGAGVWILDAKSPSEDLVKSKNSEQAFSYAIHPEIRANYYALCNGREFVLYEISHLAPIMRVKLCELTNSLAPIRKILAPEYIKKPHLAFFNPDFGLYMIKSGWNPDIKFSYYCEKIAYLAKIDDERYTTTLEMHFFGILYCVTLDFKFLQLLQLLSFTSDENRKKIFDSISQQPFSIEFDNTPIFVGFHATLGNKSYRNDNEEFLPLDVSEFFNSSEQATKTCNSALKK